MTTFTVAELARLVSRAISRALPEEVWVQGEIRDLSRAASGHVYFSLIDSDPQESPAAVLPVTLFASDKVAVNRVLQRSGAVRMTDGVEVRIRGQVTHYAARGTVQLRMTWIDTDYTLGRLAAERDRLIKSLDRRGLLEKNRSLPLSLVPLRVGLVTSAGSAAEADFLDELERSQYRWDVQTFDARVQGKDAPASIVSGLRSLADSGVDVVAIVRGGGAQTDLAAFDTEEIAVAIAGATVPVLTGIGHEIDVSIADLVSRSHKTPTACAAALVSRVAGFLDRIDRLALDTRTATRRQLDHANRTLIHSTSRLIRSACASGVRAHQLLSDIEVRTLRSGRSLLRHHSEQLGEVGKRLGRAGSFHLDVASGAVDRMSAMVGTHAMRATTVARGRLEDLEHRLELLDPQRLLARGWSITRTIDGELVTQPDHLGPGQTMRTTVAGGEIASVVTEEASDG